MDHHSLDNLGSRLSAVREALGLKQSSIGDTVGCSNGAFSLYERNKRHPPLHVLYNLCELYGLSVDYLLGVFTPQPHVFAERLQNVLNKHPDKSLDEFCKIYDLDSATAGLLISGVAYPNTLVFNKLCIYFGCSADYLLGLSDTLQPAAEKNVASQKKEPEANAIASSSILGSLPPRNLLSDMDSDLICQALSYIAYLNEQQKQRNAAEEKKKTKAKA